MSKKPNKSHKKKPPKVKPKIFEARQRNEFIKKLKLIAEASDAVTAFKLIPKDELKYLSMHRFRVFRVEAAPGHEIPSSLIHNMNLLIQESLRNEKFTIIEGREEISLMDWATVGSSFGGYLETLKDEKFENAAEVKKGFKTFITCICKDFVPQFKTLRFSVSLSSTFSEIDRRYYWFALDFCHRDPSYDYIRFLVRTEKAEKKVFQIDGIHRPAYRVGWANPAGKFEWVTIRPVDLKINSQFSEIPMDVYIQSHALRRLQERLDCRPTSVIYYCLYDSLTHINTKVIFNGSALVEYKLIDVVAGYLVIQMVSGAALIRTFLFKTQAGTPEGDRLHKILGLNKMDTQYLELDKLSTFVCTNLKDNSQLLSLLAQAGCDDLIQITDLQDEIDPTQQQAEKIAKYLNLKKYDADWADWSEEEEL